MIKNFLLFIFILFPLLKCESDCSYCEIKEKQCINCNEKCHWFKINSETEKCLFCNDKDNEESKYYAKKTTIDGINYCHKIGVTGINSGKKIIGTNLIVNDCLSLGYYQLGNLCYDNCPENSKEDINNNKICVCKSFYYKTREDNLEILNCAEKCPDEYPFHDGTTKECLTKCPIGRPYLIKSSNTNSLECRASCPNKIYNQQLTSGQIIKYCLDSCPTEYKYYYNDNICVNKCNKNPNDIISVNNKCINLQNIINTDCGDEYYITIDNEAENYMCKSGKNCPERYPLEFINQNIKFCLKKCDDTNITFFNNIITFLNLKKNECLELNKKNNETYYILEEEKIFVEDCYIDSFRLFVDGRKCVISCGEKYYVEDSNQCVDKCDISKYFIDEKTKMCVKECPSNLGRGFYNETTRKCTSCSIKGEEEMIGFHKEDSKICYSECPDGFIHINNNNICFRGECKDTNYKFISIDFPKTCFYNCPDIKNNNDKYLIEIENICYKSLPSESYLNYYYYEIIIDEQNKQDKIKKYLSPLKAIKECFKRGLKYIKNSQCIKSCDENDYKIYPNKNTFGLCFENKELCLENGYTFYNNKDKECSKVCNYFTIQDNTGNIFVDDGNCVKECPSNVNNTYDRIDGNICKKDCFYKLIDDESKKICVEFCTKSNGEYFSFYNSDKKCLDTCKDEVKNKFALEPINGHQECIEKCPTTKPYFYENEKICLEKCNKYYKILNGSKICQDTCNELILPDGNCLADEQENPCPSSSQFLIEIKNGETIQYKQCVSNCFYNGYDYYFSQNKTCSKIIPVGYYEYEGIIYESNCPYPLILIEDIEENKCKKQTNCSNEFCLKENKIICNDNDECKDYQYLTYSKEKVKKCPIWEHFIDENNHCVQKCSDFYEKIDENNGYPIYKCLNSCSHSNYNNILYKKGEKECISSCGDYFEYNNVCYSNCQSDIEIPDNNHFIFSLYDSVSQKNICNETCSGYIDMETKKCVQDCSILSPKKLITKDNQCVNNCSGKYLQIINNKYYCVEACEGTKTKHYNYIEDSITDNICKEKCNIFVNSSDNNICLDSCNKKYITINEENICYEFCPGNYPYFYEGSNLCLSECNSEDYFESEENGQYKCINETQCLDKGYKLYDYDSNFEEYNGNTCVTNCLGTDNKKYTRENGHCDIQCDSNPLGDYFYKENDKKCKKKCHDNDNVDDNENKIIYGNICQSTCQINNSEKKMYEDKIKNEEISNCINKCEYSTNNNIYYFYSESDSNNGNCTNECLNYIIENNKCLSECDKNINFKLDEQCVNTCPKSRKFIYSFYNFQNCGKECPISDYQFYSIDNENKVYKCKSFCDIYVSQDSNPNSTLCLNECIKIYPYYVPNTDNNNKKICYRKCPIGYYYIDNIDENSNNLDILKCYAYNEIPSGYILYQNSNRLVKESECNLIYFKSQSEKTCVPNCLNSQIIYIDGNSIYCLDNCSDYSSDLILSRDKKCVTSCLPNEKIIDNNNNKICDCYNLFYIDQSTGLKICLKEGEETCESVLDYPYLKEGGKECIDNCKDGIISLNGIICYSSDYQCPENSDIITLQNGLKQYKCKYKYYYKTSNKKDLVCLSENQKCTDIEGFNRDLLINETNECVEYCPFDKYTKIFEKISCVSSCPQFSKEENGECICIKYYMKDDMKFCVEECPIDYPLLIEDKNECVKKCKDTDYPYYYKNKCYSNCSKFEFTDPIEINSGYEGFNLDKYYGKFADKICYCKGVWLTDEENGLDDCKTENSCNVFDKYGEFKYMNKPSRQCVTSCSNDYPYIFNYNCFSSCEKGNEYMKFETGLQIKKKEKSKENPYECVCEGYWKYNNNMIECVKKDEKETCPEEGYLLIIKTDECYFGKECKEEYPLFFNNRCYARDNCPDNSEFIPNYPKNCTCPNLWYKKENNDIKCLNKSLEECPNDYPNLIISNNQCIKDNDTILSELYRFNLLYYDLGCPFGTYEKENNKICVCNPIYGFWYKDASNYLECALSRCPTEMPFTDEKTKECFVECPYFSYNDICYEKCPEFTQITSEDSKICKLVPKFESSNVTEVSETIKENIVDLYKSAIKEEEVSGVIEIVGGDSIIEFYGLNPNKEDSKSSHNKNKTKITSSLSYIDLSECLQNIYEDNNMRSTDDIIILKFDMLNTPKEYLINPVEYKFINSRTGAELDASACSNKKVKISYPFFNILNNYDKITNKKRNIRYLNTIMLDLKSNDLTTLSEKYNIGKEINELYPNIDTFNSKNEIYTDYCANIKINGKDLILEDRINYLFPHYSLCEYNCSYNHTDFEEERIYCDCSLKTEFDVNREHKENIVINENAISLSQNGKTNFPVLKCISVWKDSNRIKNNIAFYYLLIIIIIEICLLILTIIFGINNLQKYFQNNICNINNDDKDFEKEVNNKISNEYIKTTERNINNPPKKKNNSDINETIENNDDNNNENNNEKNNNEDNIENNYNNENNNNNNENNNNIENIEKKELNEEIQFIPDEFIFIYFNEKDEGVRKTVERNLLPFDVGKNVKVLLQKIEGIDYSNVKASGPFEYNQNILEIIGEEEKNKITLNIESVNESLFNETNNDNNLNKNKINEKELITIKEKDSINQERIYKRQNLKNYIINDNDELVEDKQNKSDNLSFLQKMRIEQRLLRKEYEFAESKQDYGFFNLLLAEILDKIYIIQIFLFLRKYDILFLNLSVYILYHVFLLNLLAMFFNIDIIQKIWTKENYPGIGFYLGYDLAASLICWVIYIIFLCLLTNKGKYNEILSIRKSKKKKNKIQLIDKKYNSLISKTKIKITVYSIVQFILIILFFIYLVTLCAIYNGTMNKIFTSYGVAILEIIIIKIIYGLVLAILRQISLNCEKKGLYNIILFMDNYIV